MAPERPYSAQHNSSLTHDSLALCAGVAGNAVARGADVEIVKSSLANDSLALCAGVTGNTVAPELTPVRVTPRKQVSDTNFRMRFFFSTGAFTATLGNLSGLLIGHCFTVEDMRRNLIVVPRDRLAVDGWSVQNRREVFSFMDIQILLCDPRGWRGGTPQVTMKWDYGTSLEAFSATVLLAIRRLQQEQIECQMLAASEVPSRTSDVASPVRTPDVATSNIIKRGAPVDTEPAKKSNTQAVPAKHVPPGSTALPPSELTTINCGKVGSQDPTAPIKRVAPVSAPVKHVAQSSTVVLQSASMTRFRPRN